MEMEHGTQIPRRNTKPSRTRSQVPKAELLKWDDGHQPGFPLKDEAESSNTIKIKPIPHSLTNPYLIKLFERIAHMTYFRRNFEHNTLTITYEHEGDVDTIMARELFGFWKMEDLVPSKELVTPLEGEWDGIFKIRRLRPRKLQADGNQIIVGSCEEAVQRDDRESSTTAIEVKPLQTSPKSLNIIDPQCDLVDPEVIPSSKWPSTVGQASVHQSGPGAWPIPPPLFAQAYQAAPSYWPQGSFPPAQFPMPLMHGTQAHPQWFGAPQQPLNPQHTLQSDHSRRGPPSHSRHVFLKKAGLVIDKNTQALGVDIRHVPLALSDHQVTSTFSVFGRLKWYSRTRECGNLALLYDEKEAVTALMDKVAADGYWYPDAWSLGEFTGARRNWGTYIGIRRISQMLADPRATYTPYTGPAGQSACLDTTAQQMSGPSLPLAPGHAEGSKEVCMLQLAGVSDDKYEQEQEQEGWILPPSPPKTDPPPLPLDLPVPDATSAVTGADPHLVGQLLALHTLGGDEGKDAGEAGDAEGAGGCTDTFGTQAAVGAPIAIDELKTDSMAVGPRTVRLERFVGQNYELGSPIPTSGLVSRLSNAPPQPFDPAASTSSHPAALGRLSALKLSPRSPKRSRARSPSAKDSPPADSRAPMTAELTEGAHIVRFERPVGQADELGSLIPKPRLVARAPPPMIDHTATASSQQPASRRLSVLAPSTRAPNRDRMGSLSARDSPQADPRALILAELAAERLKAHNLEQRIADIEIVGNVCDLAYVPFVRAHAGHLSLEEREAYVATLKRRMADAALELVSSGA